jgi:hypothetical protein
MGGEALTVRHMVRGRREGGDDMRADRRPEGMTWIAEKPENGTENKVLYDTNVSQIFFDFALSNFLIRPH